MTGIGRFAVGLLAGLIVAAALGLLLRGDESPPTTSTTTTTVAAEPEVEPWFEPGEVMIGATALLPRELTVEDGIAFFDYDLTGIGPTLGGDPDEQRPDLATPYGDHLAMPEHWVLTTQSGQDVTATTGPFDSSVRFELPSTDAEVASIQLVGWRIAVPFGHRVELPIEEGASGEMRRGTVIVETVLEQSISTIVQMDYDNAGDSWDVDVALRPLDTRWRTSGRQGGGLQLIWDGDDAPATVILEDAGFEMRPVIGELPVVDQGSDL